MRMPRSDQRHCLDVYETLVRAGYHEEDLLHAALLHDVGKIGIRDNVLLKPGPLTDDEYEVMKEHVNHGVDIVEKIGGHFGLHPLVMEDIVNTVAITAVQAQQ